MKYEIWFDQAGKQWKLEDTDLMSIVETFKHESDAQKEVDRLNTLEVTQNEFQAEMNFENQLEDQHE